MPLSPEELAYAAANYGKGGPAIELVNGARFYLFHPDPGLMNPIPIAHSLAQLCRFTGHSKVFYSVAQHCVMVSYIVPEELALEGLLHDASEAFIGDLSRPLKYALELKAPDVVREIEDRLHEAIALRYGTGFPHHPKIKLADNIALATEKRDVMVRTDVEWQGLPEPLPERIEALMPEDAMDDWLNRYQELGGRL